MTTSSGALPSSGDEAEAETSVRLRHRRTDRLRPDRPWRRPGRVRHAITRVAGVIRPRVVVTSPATPMLVQRDVPVPVRDGCVLRVNVYRPEDGSPAPVLMSAHPYGKDSLPRAGRWGGRYPFQYRVMRQTGPVTFSTETGWEGPDPERWVARGFAVVIADLRGAGTSDGIADVLSLQEGEDVHDLVEWAAAQPWSTGRVGMLGVSYLALTQWRAASLRPPHLAAICPWEGFTDAYRDLMRPGGILETGFLTLWSRGMRGVRQHRSIADQAHDHPLRDRWWRSLVPDLEAIDVPALVCGSFSDNNLHSRGSFRGFSTISSTEKHLWTHRSGKWATFYGDEAQQAQAAFFDRHLHRSPVEPLPRVRLEVRSSRDVITSVRDEPSWPPPTSIATPLHLGDAGLLATPGPPGSASFRLRRGGVRLGCTFTAETEVVGAMSVRLWVELHDTRDADLFVGVEKWDHERYVPFEGSYGFGRDRITTGWQRVALRSTTLLTASAFDHPRPLSPGEIVPVEVELGPSATHFSAGESLRLVIAGRWLWPRNPLTGQFPARYDSLKTGRCTVHWGGDHHSSLTVPITRGTG